MTYLDPRQRSYDFGAISYGLDDAPRSFYNPYHGYGWVDVPSQFDPYHGYGWVDVSSQFDDSPLYSLDKSSHSKGFYTNYDQQQPPKYKRNQECNPPSKVWAKESHEKFRPFPYLQTPNQEASQRKNTVPLNSLKVQDEPQSSGFVVSGRPYVQWRENVVPLEPRKERDVSVRRNILPLDPQTERDIQWRESVLPLQPRRDRDEPQKATVSFGGLNDGRKAGPKYLKRNDFLYSPPSSNDGLFNGSFVDNAAYLIRRHNLPNPVVSKLSNTARKLRVSADLEKRINDIRRDRLLNQKEYNQRLYLENKLDKLKRKHANLEKRINDLKRERSVIDHVKEHDSSEDSSEDYWRDDWYFPDSGLSKRRRAIDTLNPSYVVSSRSPGFQY